jgi:drug/metabolite transporter (DMT)-like permease
MDYEAVGMLAALGSAASWALGSILFKRLGEKISPLGMTLAKGVISVVLLGFTLVFTGYNNLSQESLLLLIASGLLGIALGDTFFFAALQDLGPHLLIVLLMSGQVLTIIFALVFLGETPALLTWWGIALVISGIALVMWTQLAGEKQTSHWRGIAFGLLAVFCLSVSIIMAKKGLESISAIQATFIRMLAGTTGMMFFGLGTGQIRRWMKPFKDFQLIKLFLVSVGVITFGGFWLSLVAIKYVDVSVANTLNSTEPLFVLPLAAIFLKEKIKFNALIGTAIATLGIVFICQA